MSKNIKNTVWGNNFQFSTTVYQITVENVGPSHEEFRENSELKSTFLLPKKLLLFASSLIFGKKI